MIDHDDYSLGLGDGYRSITMYDTTVNLAQALREFFHNSAHAMVQLLLRQGYSGIDELAAYDRDHPSRNPHIVFDIGWFGKSKNKTAKLTIVDRGCGMNRVELRANIGKLASSGVRNTERKGMGAKIAGLNLSPWGLQYTSWNGIDPPVRGIIRLDHDNEACGWVELAPGEYFTHPTVKSLHPNIREAGHGTEVMMLGASDTDDTFVRYRKELGRSKAFSYFINTRYYRLPAGLRVAMATSRSKDEPHETDLRSFDVSGMQAAIEYSSDETGIWHGDGYDIVWSYTGDVSQHVPGRRRYTNGDNALVHQVVGVSIDDCEVPGLWETYDLHVNGKARRHLAEFRLGPIANHVSLNIIIHDRHRLGIDTNPARTHLVYESEPIDLLPMAEAFREAMPQRLDEILSADIASRVVDYEGKLAKIVRENPELFTLPKTPTSPVSTDPDVPTPGDEGGFGGLGSDGADGTGKPGGKRTGTGGKPTKGRNGSKPGGHGRNINMAPDTLITTAVWLADNRPDDEANCFARHDDKHRILEVNLDCPLIAQEVEFHKRKRGVVSVHDVSVITEVVTMYMTLAAMEALVRAENLKRIETNPKFRTNWDFAFTPHGITMAVASAHGRESLITSEITKALGRKSRV